MHLFGSIVKEISDYVNINRKIIQNMSTIFVYGESGPYYNKKRRQTIKQEVI